MVKKITEALGTVIIVVAVLLVAFMLLGPRFGWETHPVLSGSMEPALKVGGLIVTKPEKIENIAVGNIITFQIGAGSKVTHRVADINPDKEGKIWFQTKGDANEEPDQNLVSSNTGGMRKVVFHLSYLGFVAVFMKSKLVFLVLVGIALILIGMFSRDIWKGILEEKEKRKSKVNKP